MRIIDKRSIILLELLIAMALTTLILTVLTATYRQFTLMNVAMDKTQNESFAKRYAESRLAFIFPRALPFTKNNNVAHFFTVQNPVTTGADSDSLIWAYDNCVKLNKDITHNVIGQLFVDSDDNLTLATWPSEARWHKDFDPPMHKEIIMREVESLSFSFFAPPERRDSKNDNAAIVPNAIQDSWINEWKKEYHALPAIVKLKIKTKPDQLHEEGKTIVFAFPIPHAYQPIIYNQ